MNYTNMDQKTARTHMITRAITLCVALLALSAPLIVAAITQPKQN